MFRKMEKMRFFTFVMAFMLALGSGASVWAEEQPVPVEIYRLPLHFVFDGKELTPPDDQQGFLYEGSTYVPLRFLAYSLKKAVRWDQDTYTVTVEEPQTVDLVTINDYLMNREVRDKKPEKVDAIDLQPSWINVYIEKIVYVFDGVVKEPPAELPGFIIQDVLYVPLRFFSEALGRKIEWNQETYTVSAVTPGGADPANPGAQPMQDGDKKSQADQKSEGEKKPEGDKKSDNAPAAGGGPAVGGGGAGKPSKESIEQKYIDRATALRDRCSNELWDLAAQYLETKDKAARSAIKSRGQAKLSACESEFNQITAGLASELSVNGYTTEKVDEMKDAFKREKEAGEIMLCGSAGCTRK